MKIQEQIPQFDIIDESSYQSIIAKNDYIFKSKQYWAEVEAINIARKFRDKLKNKRKI